MDAGHQLARRERLGQVVVAADRETDDAVQLLRSSREEDDVRIGEGPDQAEDLEPVEARQHDVEDHHVRDERECLIDGRRAIRGLGDQHPSRSTKPRTTLRIGASSSTTRTRIGLVGLTMCSSPAMGGRTRPRGAGSSDQSILGAAARCLRRQSTTVIVPVMPASWWPGTWQA